MESVHQQMAQGSTKEAGGGKVTGAVSNSSFLCCIRFSLLVLSCLSFSSFARISNSFSFLSVFTALFHSWDL